MLYDAPQEFKDKLELEFGGRLSINWEYTAKAWAIEQHVGEHETHKYPVQMAGKDPSIRRRLCLGNMAFMYVQPGTRMRCPTVFYDYSGWKPGAKLRACDAILPVPLFESAQVNCPKCQKAGREYRHFGAYFTLSDTLIEYLKDLDPLKGRTRIVRDRVDRNNAANEARLERNVLNPLYAAGAENYNQMAGIQSVGYTGRVFSKD